MAGLDNCIDYVKRLLENASSTEAARPRGIALGAISGELGCPGAHSGTHERAVREADQNGSPCVAPAMHISIGIDRM